MKFINKLIRDNAGATAIEYGLIAALISLAGITAFNGLGTAVKTQYNGIATGIPAVAPAA
jgi:pilus assembly protein Flp/PilA